MQLEFSSCAVMICSSSSVQSEPSMPDPEFFIRVVVKIMVPFWVPIIIRHLLFRVPQNIP